MTRQIAVDFDRVRTLAASGIVESESNVRAKIEREIAEQFATELAKKLMEFGKVWVSRTDNGVSYYISLDIVVPKESPSR